jgi:hypothetical protein
MRSGNCAGSRCERKDAPEQEYPVPGRSPFVAEYKWKEFCFSLCLKSVNRFDGIEISLAKANDTIVAVVRFSSKIRELDHPSESF